MTGQDGAGNMAGLDRMPARDELRRLVREVLRELLPAAAADQPVAGGGPGAAGRRDDGGGGAAAAGRLDGAVRAVRLTTEEELHAFVVEVLRLAGDPQRRIDLLAGRIRFIPAQPAAGAGRRGQAVRRVENGAVTERAVIAAARAGDRLVLGPRAVLTPLARDKARALGVPVDKER